MPARGRIQPCAQNGKQSAEMCGFLESYQRVPARIRKLQVIVKVPRAVCLPCLAPPYARVRAPSPGRLPTSQCGRGGAAAAK